MSPVRGHAGHAGTPRAGPLWDAMGPAFLFIDMPPCQTGSPGTSVPPCNPAGVTPGENAVPESNARRPLTEPERMEVFRALVEAQDRGAAVAQSRAAVAERFGVSEQQVREVEREGMEGQWPPLG